MSFDEVNGTRSANEIGGDGLTVDWVRAGS
jgi:hypothetical protein